MNTTKKLLTLLITLHTFCSISQTKGSDTIHAAMEYHDWQRLKPSESKYIRFIEEDDQIRILDLWSRKVSFEEKAGDSVLVVSQVWSSSKLEKFRKIESVSESNSFKPLIHKRYISDKGMEAYRFLENGIIGMKEIPGNIEKEFSRSYDIMPFNFEMDFEILSSLPLELNYEAIIQFYHPGGTPPKYYKYTVIGQEKLPAVRTPIDTWILYTDYGGSSPTRLWISKKDQKVIKQESSFNDKKIYKVRLY